MTTTMPGEAMQPKAARVALLAVPCAVAGWFAMALPWQRALATGATRATNPVDGMQTATLLLLPLIGLVAGALAPRIGWMAACATLAAFPALAVVEMVRDPTSHNLWPFEFLVYGVLTLLAVAPAFAIGWLRRRRAAPR